VLGRAGRRSPVLLLKSPDVAQRGGTELPTTLESAQSSRRVVHLPILDNPLANELMFAGRYAPAPTSIPSWMSEKFAAELDNAGVDVELLLVDAKHAFTLKPLSNPENVQSLAAIEAFLSARSGQ